MMAARIQTTPALAIGAPAVLFPSQRYEPIVPPRPGGEAGRTYDVASDGRFLLIKEDQAITGGVDIVFVQHWLEELKRLVPAR
jgi:hypothetical protein